MRAWTLIFSLLFAISVVILYAGHYEALPAQGSGVAQVGGAFLLTDTQGRPVRDTDFRGKPMLVYMGYSNCPDVCPMTLELMSDTLKLLGPGAGKVAAIFITLDPERDTPAILKNYLSHFDRRIIGLTGSAEETANVAKAYKAYSRKSATPATGSYLVDHSGFLYLMDAEGKYVRHFGPDVKAGELAKAVKELFYSDSG